MTKEYSTKSRRIIVPRPDIVISGGQTGADMGSLLAAKALGIATGGVAPAGFRTENGPRRDLGTVFGLIECSSADYTVRTRQNVAMADVVILVACNFDSPGTKLTKRLAIEMRVPCFDVVFPTHTAVENTNMLDDVKIWLKYYKPSVLMVAGNRESKAKGIELWTKGFIWRIFA